MMGKLTIHYTKSALVPGCKLVYCCSLVYFRGIAVSHWLYFLASEGRCLGKVKQQMSCPKSF